MNDSGVRSRNTMQHSKMIWNYALGSRYWFDAVGSIGGRVESGQGGHLGLDAVCSGESTESRLEIEMLSVVEL